MKRKEFLVSSCSACIAAIGMGGLLSSCKTVKYFTGTLNRDGLLVDRKAFDLPAGASAGHRPYVIVRNENLKFPICIYRVSDSEYTALWMQCTHQGAELQVAGNMLQCPAHGSEFSDRGIVSNGPAAASLRTFPVTIQNDQLFIDLRKK